MGRLQIFQALIPNESSGTTMLNLKRIPGKTGLFIRIFNFSRRLGLLATGDPGSLTSN